MWNSIIWEPISKNSSCSDAADPAIDALPAGGKTVSAGRFGAELRFSSLADSYRAKG
jgi:hypothetical protein